MAKIKLLGVYNQSRGKHSCGLAIDNQLYIGTGLEKEFADFIVNDDIPDPIAESVVLGHTRYATTGAHTEKNAHPFLIGEGENQWVGVHNGTIENIKELVDKYDVDTTGMEVDSQMLYKILYERGWEVLNDYRGYAALLFHPINEPSVLYAYHGASRYDRQGSLFIERPLHYLAHEGGCYFSSEGTHLKAIRDGKYNEEGIEKVPITLPHNDLIRIDYSVGVKPHIELVHKATREDTNIGIRTYTTVGSYNNSFRSVDSKNTSSGKGNSSQSVNSPNIPSKEKKAYFTPEDVKYVASYLSFTNGIYYAGGKRLNGVFSISQYGTIQKEGAVTEPFYYFYRGILLRDRDSYNNFFHSKKSVKKANQPSKFSRVISNYSMYPVMTSPLDTNVVDDQEVWYWGGRTHPFLEFTPLFSTVTYKIRNRKNCKIEQNGTYASGVVAECVFTHSDDDNDDSLVDNALIDFPFDITFLEQQFTSYRSLVMELDDTQLSLLTGYVNEAYFEGQCHIDHIINTKLLDLIKQGALFSLSVEESVNITDFFIRDYIDLVMADWNKTDDDDDDDIEEEDQDDDDTRDVINRQITKYNQTLENSETIETIEAEEIDEEMTAKEEIKEALDDLLLNLKANVAVVEQLEKIDDSIAAELAVILASGLMPFKNVLASFLKARGYAEEATELNTILPTKVPVLQEVVE